MIQVMRFLIKANIALILTGFIMLTIALFLGGFFKILPYIFLLFFFYEWNVSSKKLKTWLYIETLPISLFSRYLLRVIVPFLFSFTLIYFLETAHNIDAYTSTKALLDACRLSCIFVLSSIIATSLSSYILSLLTLNAIVFFLSFLHLYTFPLLIVTFFYSFYLLSQGRLSKTRYFFVPMFVGVMILISSQLMQNSILKALIHFPFPPMQTYCAQMLVENNFLDHSYDDVLVEKVESLVVGGSECNQYCQLLAHEMTSYPDNWNQEQLLEYLNSPEESKQLYVLIILKHSGKVLSLNRVLQLVNSNNKDIRNSAIAVLNNWGIESFHDIPGTEVF